ncbi:MAG: hypothetical protein HY364_00160 [Candidatus Aenigmarchaeota archaeon]|nr:hypothetical protein [Candidatus Aenigmarchaeota archaeon]
MSAMHKGWLLAAFVVVSLFQASHAGEWKECSSANLGEEIGVDSKTYTCCYVSSSAQWKDDVMACDRPVVTVTHSPASVGIGAAVGFTATATSSLPLSSIIIFIDENDNKIDADGKNSYELQLTSPACTGQAALGPKTCTYSSPSRTYNTDGQIVNYKAFAQGSKGRISDVTSPKSFTVSSNPIPVSAITVTPDREWYGPAHASATLRFDYSDASSVGNEKLQQCEYTITRAGTPTTTSVSCSSVGSATQSTSLILSDCGQGASGCVASARAKDNRDFISPVTRNIGVDRTSPSATSPVPGASCTAAAGKVAKGETVVYSSTASDALSGVAGGTCKLQIKKASDSWASATEYPFTGGCSGACSTPVSGPASLTEPGIYNTRVLCIDNAGNAMTDNTNIDNVEVTNEECSSIFEVTVTDSKDPVERIEAFAYTVNVKNTRAATANAVSFSLVLPAAFADFLGTPESCSQSESTMTCQIGNLAGEGESSTTISVSSKESVGTFRVDATAIDAAGSTGYGNQLTTVIAGSSSTTTLPAGPVAPPSGACSTEGAEQCVGGRHYVCQNVGSSLCASGTDRQRYNDGMSGCEKSGSGGITQDQAASLCASGTHLCTLDEYLSNGGRTTPPDLRFYRLGDSTTRYLDTSCSGTPYFLPGSGGCLVARQVTNGYSPNAASCATATQGYFGYSYPESGYGSYWDPVISNRRFDYAGTCYDTTGYGSDDVKGAVCCGIRAPSLQWQDVGACVPDFSISHDPNPLTLAPGEMGIANVNIDPINEFTGNVRLSGSWSGTPLPGDAITEEGRNFLYIPDSISPAAPGQLFIYADRATPFRDYTMRTTGTSGSLIRTGDLTVRVGTPEGFAVVYPSPILIIKKHQKGNAVGIANVEIIPSAFAQPVTLSGRWLDDAPAGVTFLFNPAVSIASEGTRESDLIMTVPALAPEGVYILETIGTAATGERNTYLIVIIESPGTEPFIIGPDMITVNDIKYDYVERKFVEIIPQFQKLCTAPEGCPDFTRGMVSDFFVAATVNSIPETECSPDAGCSGTYTFGGKTLPLVWNPFRKAWKGTMDTLDADFGGVCTDREFDLDVSFVTETLSKDSKFKVHINCDPKVVVSPFQARVPIGQKNLKIFDIMTYDPATIDTPAEKYDIEVATDKLAAKSEFLRHWIAMQCDEECNILEEDLDEIKALREREPSDLAILLAGNAGEKGVLSSDLLFRGEIPASDPSRGLYVASVRLNDKGAQIAGTYEYVFRASRNPVTEGKGVLAVYAEGLDQFSFIQAIVTMLIGSLIAIVGARKP